MKLPKVLVAAVIGLSVTFGSTACTTSKPVTGVVVEKDADASQKKSCKKKTVNGKKKSCKKKAADYDVTLRDAQGNEHEIEVSRSEFDKIQIGQTYTSR